MKPISIFFVLTIASTFAVVAFSACTEVTEFKDCWVNLGIVEDKRMLAWRGDNYLGSEVGGWGACRMWDSTGRYLLVHFDHFGGYDAGTSRYEAPRQLSEVRRNPTLLTQNMQAKYAVRNLGSDKSRYSGHFYMGPKTGFHRKPEFRGDLSYYECYVIEYSSRSVQGFKQWLLDLKGWKVGSSRHNGENYSHYRRNHKHLWQIFAVRDTWRPTGGRTDIMQIAKAWLDTGAVNSEHSDWWYLGWKHNFETENRIKGTIEFSDMTFM